MESLSVTVMPKEQIREPPATALARRDGPQSENAPRPALLCGSPTFGACRVSGEDVGAIRFGLMRFQVGVANLVFPALVFLRSASALALSAMSMHHVKWDCFVWLTNLDCGKASPLLRSSLDLGRIPAAP
jgi:hypothetical protein